MNEDRFASDQPSGAAKRRLRLFFGKKSTDGRELFSENRLYYERLADVFHRLRSLAALLLAAVILVSCSMAYSLLADNQFAYLYKIWTVNPVTIGKQYNDISYAAGNGAKFILYKNDLAVVEGGRIAVYDLTGDRRFRAEAPNSAHASAVSEKYIALYTPGDKKFVIYDSFSEIYDYIFPYPIRLAAVSDSGKFALCLREDESLSVEVYNRNSAKEFSVSLDEDTTVFDLDLSPNGDKLALTTIISGETAGVDNYYTEFSLWDVSSGKLLFSEQIKGKRPVETSFFDNSRLYFAAKGSVIFCRSNGKKTETASTSLSARFAVSDGKTVAVSDGASYVSVYDPSGEKKTEFSLSESIFDLKVKDGFCYVLSGSSIRAYDGDGACAGTYAVGSGVMDFFVLDDGSLLVCYASETKRIAP